jgi:tRNA(Arg) A34 adenosine deaminase TadA/catechol 2,3-dioxygenase-like lactoylglutathione lyase family enzyme
VATDAELLDRAVRLALANAADGQLPFGALVVRDGEVLSVGVNTALRDGDPTAHAETVAVRTACRRLGTLDLAGAVVVSSCQPCPMCHAAALLAGISRIFYAATKEDAERAGFVLPPAASRVHALLEEAGADHLQYVATPGAEEPFARFAELAESGQLREPAPSPVRELRVAVTAEDYEPTLVFYRDVLGLAVVSAWDGPTGSGAILDAGRATLELLSTDQADVIDRIEVGRRVAGPIRLALEVEDSAETARQLVGGGAELVGTPVVTPWGHRNVRVRAPDGMQLTLFTVLEELPE